MPDISAVCVSGVFSMMVKRVAVIGAGAGGLCALRRLTAQKEIQAVGFEQGATVGGTWVYTERVGKDEHGLPVHASMYSNLRCAAHQSRQHLA